MKLKHNETIQGKENELKDVKKEHEKTCTAYEGRLEQEKVLKDNEIQELKTTLSKVAQDQLNNAKQIYLDLQTKHNTLAEEMETLKVTYKVTNENLIQLTSKYGQLEAEYMTKNNAFCLLEKATMETKLQMKKDKESLESLKEENGKRATNANYLYAEIAEIKKNYS